MVTTFPSATPNWRKKTKNALHAPPRLPAQSVSISFQNDANSSDTSTTTGSCFKILYRFCEKKMKVRAIYRVFEWFCLCRGQEMCPVTFGHIILNY